MKWEKDTAADIVMGAAAKIAEDMVHGTAAAVQDISRYHTMFKNMSRSLTASANGLQKHVLRKKWMAAADKKAVRLRISQIRAIARICDRLRSWCSAYAVGSIGELKKMEMDGKLTKIVSRIESESEDQ